MLRRWMGSARKTYNWALACIKANPKEYTPRRICDIVWLRKRFVNEKNIPKRLAFLLDTPKAIRDSAITDLAAAFKTNFALRKKDPRHVFDVKFRSKKADQTVSILRDNVKSWGSARPTTYGGVAHDFQLFPTYCKKVAAAGTDLKTLFGVRHRNGARVPDAFEYDSKLTLTRIGRFYLHMPCHEAACDNQAGHDSRHEWGSIDTGVRTMWTIYSPDVGVCFRVGDGDISRIYRLCLKLDNLISRTTSCNSLHQHSKSWNRRQHPTSRELRKVKRNMHAAQLRMRKRIRDLVNEVHCKAVHFLVENFKNIVLPPFQVSQMVKNRVGRKISSKSVRQMLCWSHYKLRMRLQHVVDNTPGTCLFIRGEEYTTKCCSNCCNLKENVGSAKIYKCTKCGLKIDRDLNGARNIFMKNTAPCT